MGVDDDGDRMERKLAITRPRGCTSCSGGPVFLFCLFLLLFRARSISGRAVRSGGVYAMATALRIGRGLRWIFPPRRKTDSACVTGTHLGRRAVLACVLSRFLVEDDEASDECLRDSTVQEKWVLK